MICIARAVCGSRAIPDEAWLNPGASPVGPPNTLHVLLRTATRVKKVWGTYPVIKTVPTDMATHSFRERPSSRYGVRRRKDRTGHKIVGSYMGSTILDFITRHAIWRQHLQISLQYYATVLQGSGLDTPASRGTAAEPNFRASANVTSAAFNGHYDDTLGIKIVNRGRLEDFKIWAVKPPNPGREVSLILGKQSAGQYCRTSLFPALSSGETGTLAHSDMINILMCMVHA